MSNGFMLKLYTDCSELNYHCSYLEAIFSHSRQQGVLSPRLATWHQLVVAMAMTMVVPLVRQKTATTNGAVGQHQTGTMEEIVGMDAESEVIF